MASRATLSLVVGAILVPFRLHWFVGILLEVITSSPVVREVREGAIPENHTRISDGLGHEIQTGPF